MPRNPYHPGLMCSARRLEYDYRTHEGTLYITNLECTDCQGAITMFTAVDAKVKKITVVSGRQLDVVYERSRVGWVTHEYYHNRVW